VDKDRLYELLQKEAEFKARVSKYDLKPDEKEALQHLQK